MVQTRAIELSQEQTGKMMMRAIRDEVRFFNLTALTESLEAFQDAMKLQRVEVIGPYGIVRAEVGIAETGAAPDQVVKVSSDHGDHFGTIHIWGGVTANTWAEQGQVRGWIIRILPFVLLLAMFATFSMVFLRLVNRNVAEPLNDLCNAIQLSNLENQGIEQYSQQLSALKSSRSIRDNIEILEIAESFEAVAEGWKHADEQKDLALDGETFQREMLVSVLESAGMSIIFYGEKSDGDMVIQGAHIDANLLALLKGSGLDLENIIKHSSNYGMKLIDNKPASLTQLTSGLELQSNELQRWYIERFQNRPGEFALLISDVTQARKTEKILSTRDREVTMARLTSGISHDFNNILATISGALALIREGDGKNVYDYIDTISSATKRASHFVSRLREVELQQGSINVSVDQHAILCSLERILPASLGPTVQLNVEGTCDSHILGEDDEFEACVLNYIFNSKDAIGSEGQITVRSRIANAEEIARLELPDRACVAFDFIDDGPGVDIEIADHIFKQFFTTKAPDKGSGLGLSQNEIFAKKYGGGVFLANPGKPNAHFTMLLPLSENLHTLRPDPGRTTQDTIDLGGTSIAIVDDQASVGKVLELCMAQFNATTTYSASYEEFRKALSKSPPHVVISDVHMPSCTYLDIYELVRKLAPDARLIFASGDHNALDEISERLKDVEVVQKPINIRHFAMKIGQKEQSGQSSESGTLIEA